MGFDHAEQKELDPPDADAAASSSSGVSGSLSDTEKAEGWERDDDPADSIVTLPDDEARRGRNKLEHEEGRHVHRKRILKLRSADDDLPTSWWFASTAIPLIAATFAPMANLISIAALVASWRNNIIQSPQDDPLTYQSTSVGYPDPRWCTDLNIASLACGFVGNLFLLFNFTKRVRYIVALPATIILFYIASGILIGITVSMNHYVPPGPDQLYSQGYWNAVIAACLYMFNSMILMVNMCGYFLGHYPQHFALSDEQRNLILQTILFFIWLGGGAGVFSRIEEWDYPDALYFCDVTILTVGFGDYYPTDDVGRGIVLPYSVGGIIILGLMVSSVAKFARELSSVNVLQKHVENRRVDALSRVVTAEEDQRRTDLEKMVADEERHGLRPSISSPLPNPQIQRDLDAAAHPARSPLPRNPAQERQVGFADDDVEDMKTGGGGDVEPHASQFFSSPSRNHPIRDSLRLITKPVATMRKARSKTHKVLLMKEEKDRFDAMREIQLNAKKFKKWYALCMSAIAFGLLWCLGAVVFWRAERNTQALSYFEALYFCYVSLLTIGYGDLSPKSNAGKPFFVVWSLIAIPTMTILISDMGDTVISSFKRGTFRLGDLTVLPKAGLWHDLLRSTGLSSWMSRRATQKRLRAGLPVGMDDEAPPILSIEQLASENLTEAELTSRLAWAIRKTADDLQHAQEKRYTYEEWCEFTRLIRFSKVGLDQCYDEEADGVVEWDWLEDSSPMLSLQSEPEWILDRLCESLLRLLKRRGLGMSPGPNSALPLSSTGNFSTLSFNRRGTIYDDPLAGQKEKRASKGKGVEPSRPAAAAELQRRASGAHAVLTFFTGDDKGLNTYANEGPRWSKKARERQKENRRNAAGLKRRGPFSKLQHYGTTGAVGGGRGGAGGRTLKMRQLNEDEDERDS